MRELTGRPWQALRVKAAADHVLLLTLHRPEVLNALDTHMAGELETFFAALAEPPGDLRAVVVTGAGGKAFCAGADLKERQGMDEPAWHRHHEALEKAFAAIRGCPVPLLAAVHGAALGGGCELVLACDLAVAAETASFAQPEVRRGILPGCGATWALPRRIGLARAKEMVLTGRTVPAAEALAWGLVNRVVPPAEVLPATLEMARQVAANAPVAVRAAKAALDGGLDLGREEGIAAELRAYRRTIATADRREGSAAFAERRAPRFENR